MDTLSQTTKGTNTHDMETVFKTWATSRKLYLNILDSFSLDQLNFIPAGFSNNLIWNIGHIIVAQQSLIYRGSNLPMNISDQMIDAYKPGSRPDANQPTPQSEVDHIRELLMAQVEQTKSDFRSGLFTTYTERTTITGFHLTSVADAFEFNNYHEGLHMGLIMAIRKFV